MLGQNHESEVHTDSGLLLVENYYQCPSAVLSGARQQFLEGPEGPYYHVNNVNEKVLFAATATAWLFRNAAAATLM